MSGALKERCHYAPYLSKVCSAKDCVKFFRDGQYLGWSGFTPVGDPKVVPIALAEHVEQNHLQGKMRFNLYIGSFVSENTEGRWAKNDMIASRFPYQSSPVLRNTINSGRCDYHDKHLSMFPQELAWGFYTKGRKTPLDIAIIEATEILDDGSIVLAGSVGSSPEECQSAEKIIIELNTAIPSFKGCHDIVQAYRPPLKPLNICNVHDRIGDISIKVDPRKVIAVVESKLDFPGRPVKDADDDEKKIGQHVVEFFHNEVKHGRLPESLYPLQSGVGNIGNAVLEGLDKSNLSNLTVYTEVAQDAMLPMFDSGKLRFASSSSFTLSNFEHLYNNFEFYKKKFVLRPVAISNAPEVIRRLGCIALDTPIEFDIYGHANSTHIDGTKLENGLGGSADFLRNAYISIAHCPSARKTKTHPTGISSVVPMVSHCDHTEHDIDILVTEQGVADCRGLSPVQRARCIIKNCAHPDYKDQLTEYLNLSIKACQHGRGHEPHMLDKVFKMHTQFLQTKNMHLDHW